MKKQYTLFFMLPSLVFVLGIAGFMSAGISVSGKFKNAAPGSYIYLYEQIGTEIRKIDSSLIKNDAFSFKTKTGYSRGFYRIGTGDEASFQLILANENVEIDADATKLDDVKISGSRENLGFGEYKKFNEKFQGYYQQLNSEAQQAEQSYSSDPTAYNNKIKDLQKRLDSLNKIRYDFYAKIQSSNKGLYIEKYIKALSVDTLSKGNFFNDGDFKDPELARADVLPTKISIYMQKFVPQQLENWKSESDVILAKSTVLNLNKEVIYITVIRNMANNDIDYTKSVAKRYLSDFPNSKMAKHFWSLLPKSTPTVGEDAPNIVLASPDGKTIQLSSLKGKVVLLDFWASWCGPCRRENPNVVKAYEKYKDKGFTVYSVSLDTEKDRWLKAIQADGLVWENHVSDLQGWQSSAAKLYGVRGIPSTFLLDKSGKVIAVNLRGESLELKLSELLK